MKTLQNFNHKPRRFVLFFKLKKKMRDINTWYDNCLSAMTTYFGKLTEGFDSAAPGDDECEEIIQALDAVLIVDYLKTWQAGLNNDFSMYRRAIQHVKKDYNMSDDETLRFFLVNPNNIIKGLKKECEKIKEFFFFFLNLKFLQAHDSHYQILH
jgi:hypothetical protein